MWDWYQGIRVVRGTLFETPVEEIPTLLALVLVIVHQISVSYLSTEEIFSRGCSIEIDWIS